MPVFNDERILNLSVNQQEMPEPALGSPQQAELPRPPALPAVGGGIASDDKSRLGLSGDQLSKLANIPSLETGPNLIPIGEVVANKRYSTYARNMDLENIYGLQQAWYDQLGNSAVKFAATTVGTFAQQFASIPNTISAMKNGSLAELSGGPDGYEAAIDTWTRNLEDAFPNYFTKWEREHPFLSAITPSGAANFWGDKILKNLGFTAGAIAGAAVQDLAVGTITQGVGAVPLVASQIGKASLWLNKILAGTNKVDKALDLGRMAGATTESIASAKKLGEIAEGVRLTDKFRYTTALYGASRTEAAVEARESYREIKEELIREHKRTTGEEPDGRTLDEIESYATDAMNTRFGVNMALLTVSNAVQFGNVFKSFTSSAKKGAQQLTRTVDDAGRVGLKEGSLDVFEKVVPKTKTERVWNAVRPKIDDLFSEGVYEEGGQFATQKAVTDYYTRKYKNKDNWNAVSETVESTLTGLKDQFGTSEGLENMMIGALTAILTGGAKSYIDKKRGLTNDTRLNQVIGMLNSQGVTGILSNQYDATVDAVGIAKDMEKAVEEGDIFKYKNLKSDMFFNLVNSRIPSGMHDVTIEQLKMLKDLDKDQFESLFGMDFNSSNKKTVSQYVDNLILKANEIKKTSDSLNSTFKNPFAFTKAPKTPDQELENKKHVKFENWKMDLANFSFRSKDMDSRRNSIQQSLFEINPRLSADVLERVTNVKSLKELSKQYEEKAVQLQKSITEATPADVARDLRAQVRNLRSMSEKTNVELSSDEKNGKWLIDLLNFELNNQDEKAPPVLGLENLQDIFTYGVDLNRLTSSKKEIAKSFEYLSSEKGFDEYLKDSTAPSEKDEKEEEAPSPYEFVNKRGEKEPIQKDRQYQIPAFKKASVQKIDEDRYQVTDAEGNILFYKSQEEANIAASESDEKYAGLENVRVVALNADGSIKVEDANGDVYDIPISRLQGYEIVKTEQEKLEVIKDDVEQQQNQLELSDSGTVAGTPFLDDAYKGNPEDFRKHWGWLFWSTTSASEDRDVDSKKPHAQRSIAFLNNVKKFPNKGSMRVMLVTPKQEDALGLTGLHNLSMGEDIKRDASGNVIISDTNNALVAAVYVEQQGSEYYFVNKEGKRIGKVGDQVDLNQVVFSTMPDTSLFWDEGGKGAERYRVQEKKEAEEMSQRWALKRKELFNLASDKPEIYSFTVSNGIPVINDIKERNHVGGTLIDENRIKSQEGLIVVSTKGTLTHNGQSYKIGAGRAMIQYEDVFVPAVNHKFNKNQAESIYEVLRLLAADIQKQAANNKKIKFDPIYVKYLSNLLYWKKSEAAKGGANQMFIDSKMNLILGDKKYDITKLDQFKKEITEQLLNAYHTVNNKSLSSTEEAGINKFHERFVEFYVEEEQLKEREWTNYQTYLLSAKYPDGTARSANDTPVTTFVAKPTDLVPYNFKQKYAMLSETEFPALPVRPTAKTETPSPTAAPKVAPIKIGDAEFIPDGTTLYTSTKVFMNEAPVQFSVSLSEAGKIKVKVDPNKQTGNHLVAISEKPESLAAIENTLRKVLKENYNESSTPEEKVAEFAAFKILSILEGQQAAPVAAPQAPAPSKVGKPITISEGTITIEPPSTETFSETYKFIVKDRKVIDGIYYSYFQGEYKDTKTETKINNPEQKYNELSSVYSDDEIKVKGTLLEEKPVATPVSIEAKKADVKKDRYYNSPVNRMVKVQKESENRNLTQEEIDKIEQVIEKAKELGWDRDRLFRQLTSMGYSYALGNNPEGFKNYLEDRLSGKTNIKVTSEYNFFKQLDAELAALEGAKPAITPAVEEAPTPPPVEPAPKKKKGGKKHDDNGEYRLVETAPAKKEKISQADIEAFKQWHAEVAPNLPYEISERIFMLNDGRRAYGVFVDGVAKFYKGAIRGTEYHEVFEGIWGAFLTSEERQAILDELKAKSGTFTDRETGKKIRWDEATDKQIKERIADNFADYRLGKLPARSLSEKIVRFFKNIIEFFKRIISKPSKVDQLFDDIEKGRFKNYVVPEAVKYAVPEYRAVEGLTETDTRLYVEDMTSLIFQHMFGSNKSLYDIQKLTDKDLYEYVLQKYQDAEKIDDTDADYLSTKQFNDLFTKTKEFLRQFKIEFEEGLVGDVNNNEADNRSYAPEPFSTDWKRHSGYPIKLLLGTLIRTKPSGTVDANNIPTSTPDWSDLDGFQLLNFSKAFATVMDKLHNTSSIKKLVEKVVNLASLNSDYYRLLGRLKLNKAIKITDGVISIDFSGFESHDWRLFIQFYQTFTKQKPTALVQYMSGGNVYTSPSNLFTAAEELKYDWLTNMKLLAKERDSLIYFNSDTKRYQVGDVSAIPTTTPEQKVEFLKKLGISFPLSTYLRLSVKKEMGEKSEQEKFNDAISSIQKYISKDKDIASVTGDTLKVDAPIKRLAELYVRVENPPHETTRFNIQGERVVEFTENNHVSVFENEMNEAGTLDNLREKRPELNDVFSTSSVTLKKGGLFFDEDGNQIKKFKVSVIEGNKDVDGGKDTQISRLSKGDAAVLQFNQNLKGDYYILVPADSSTEWMINLGNNISYNDVVNGRAWKNIYTIFRNYLNDEVKLAMEDRSYLKNTAPRAKELRFFKEILPESMVNKIHQYIEDRKPISEINKYIEENIEKLNSSVKSFIESSSEEMFNDLKTYKRVMPNSNETFRFATLDDDFAKVADVDKENLTEDELNNIMLFRNINYVINNIEMHKVIFGDPYQFKIKNNQLDETKRIKSYLSPRRTTVDFPELNTALNQKRNYAGDILLTSNDLGHHEFSSNIATVTLADVDVAGSIYADLGMTTETDGFSFMMDTTYRELKIKNGQWIDEKAEPWHQWQMAYTRNRLAKKGEYIYTNGRLKEQDEKMISKPAPKHMVEVLKTIVSGNKANKTHFDNVLDKFSQMPVYYSMVEGTNLEKMYVKMWKEKIGYAVYESGRKVGAETLHSVYNKDGEFNTTPFTNIIRVPWKALGVQVETTYEEFHDDLTRGSQTTKISTIDLFDNGVATSEAAELEYKRYVDILNKYHKNGVNELFTKLGLEYLGDGKFNITDPIALSESLKHELLRRDASDNVRYTIELDENGQFRVPFESSSAYTKIRDIIFSMVDKAVNSPKMHGGAYVQVPVTMFEKLGSSRSLVIKKEVEKGKFIYEKITKEEYVKLSDAEKKNVYLTDDTLKMPTKEDPYMEVMLPHWFREKLPKKYNTDEKLLTYLNSTEEGRKLLRGIGFRIPTQALSSIAPIRVKGFLPQFAGHTVVVPSEITTMAGSDFDIDKMFIYLKSFYLDAAGDIRIVSLIDNSEEKTKEFYKNVYENTIQKEIDKIQRFDEFRDKAVDIFEKLEQFEEITLDNLEQLSEEDFEFYTTHAVLLNEMMEQAEEERLSPKDYILDQISKLDNKKDKLTQKMLNDDVKNKYIKKMYKRALENEYYDSLEKLVTLPENYERNIAPVDDAGFKKVAGELDKLTGDVGENVKNRLLNASYMTRLRHAFITAKRWVGIAAVNLTGHSNAQKTKLYLDTDRFANLSKADKELIGDGSVALPHNTVKMGNREYVSMSGRLTADGSKLYISSRLSGYATTFVDVAKDPYIMKIIKSELAVGTFMFLERIGAGQTVPFFMNQPIIRNYLEQLDESNFRSLFNGEQISYILSEFPTTEALLEETKLDVSLSSLKKNIENYRDKQTDDAYNAMQQKIFMEFLKYAKMAEYSFKLTQASNYDTTRFRSGNSLFKKQTRTSVASATNIFSSVDDVLESTHLGEQAYYLDLAVDAVGEYLQLDKKEIRENITDDILTPYAENTYLSDDKYEAIGMKVTTSLLDFVIQTKTNLNSEIANLTSESETSAISLLRKAKAKFPNDDLLQLLEGRQARTGGPWTIKLKGNDKASGYDENYFTGRMRELRDNADVETRELTTNLYNALVKLSILQGAQQSSMSIKNIIPAEDYESQIGDAVRNLKYSPEMDVFKLGMFYRNQWKNDDIFKKVSLNYRYANDNFAAIKELKIGTYSRSVLMLQEKYNIRNVSSDYIKMDRFIVDPYADEYTEGVIDLLTSNKYTPKEYKTMLAKGETAPKEILGFEKVKYPDGSPLIKYDKDGNRTFIYKRINLYGDAGYVAEYYTEFKKSVLKNGTSPIEREASNNDLIRHFTSKEVVMLNQKPITGTDMVKFTPEETFQYPNKPEFNKLPSKSSTPTMTYAGIGSRKTPPEILAQMTEVAKELESKGYRLNTGVTFGGKKEGADEAFYKGVGLLYNLFSPENQGSRSREQTIAKEIHPNPSALSPGAMKLMARNTNQVFGDNLDTPVDFVLFYAEEVSGSIRPKGGTGQAVEMARRKGIPTINMANPNWRDQFNNVLSSTEAPPFDITPTAPVTVEQEVTVTQPSATTDSYKYFGKMYDIVVENGVGVDVVGYKGKNADKQKLLNAYNTNPNVDPQNGKPFRKETAAPVQQPTSSQPVSDKPIFAYKERSIETQFILTEGQRNALSELIDFATSKEDAITLQGPAGTGKTAVIGYLQKYFGGSYNFVYMAPTHAAVAELASATVKVGNKSLPMTVASGFRMVYDPITKTSQPVIANKLGKRLGLRNNIVVVDESSMLSSKDYEMVSRALKSNNVKVIYMGDIMQIPEVDASNPAKKKVSRAFTENRQLYLTQVMRTSSDSILEMLENIRNNVNDKIPIIPSETGELRYLKSSEFNSLLAEAVENEPEDTVVIDYTNRGVSDYNKKIRESLGRTGPLQKGDVVVGYLGYASKQIEKANLANSIRYVVTDVTKDGPTYNITLFSKKLDNLNKLGVSNVTGTARTTYVPLSRNEVLEFDDISIQDMEKNNQRLSVSFENLYQAKQYALSSGTGAAWAQFYREMETMSLNMASNDLGNDYVYNPSTKRMELYDKDKHRELLKTFPELKVEKGIDFGHAITIHKSQGSTVKNVFFNASSLPKSYLSKLYVGDEQVGTEKHALLYVGVSRASGFLGINAENPENFYSPAITTFDSLTEFTPEEKTTILTNFAAKHNLTEAAAKDYINSAIAIKGKAAIISKLKECY